jgi:hypothetical protein
MSDQRVIVRVDDRVRLMSALLAMTDWPEREQQLMPHGVHLHAKNTRKHLTQFVSDNAAIQTTRQLLDGGRPLEDLFAFSQVLSWPSLRAKRTDSPDWVPDGWSAEIRNFYIAGKLANFWKEESDVWDAAVSELETIFEQGDVIEFLTPYLGEIDRTPVFLPNFSYPTAEAVAFAKGNEIFCIAPPQLATGTNPPWPYKDDPGWVYRTAFEGFGRVLLMEYLNRHPDATADLQEGKLPLPEAFVQANPGWRDQFAKIFVGAATAIFLEETFGEPESKAYIMMEHKSQGFDILPSAVSVLRRYLNEREEGKFNELADYLPVFRNSLRVAAKFLK